MLRIRAVCALLLAFSAGQITQRALAAPIFGAPIVVKTMGPVQAAFLGYEAGSVNDVYLDSPANALGIIFTNTTAAVGSTVELGTFAGGTELVFGMLHHDSGYHFFSGAASRNPDGIAHALVDDQYAPNLTRVAFEDLIGGGDRDFNDIEFSLTNVFAGPQPVPEPGRLSVVGSAIILALATRRRRRSRHE
jgi:hypothetical protein